jgi:hypothetical protein
MSSKAHIKDMGLTLSTLRGRPCKETMVTMLPFLGGQFMISPGHIKGETMSLLLLLLENRDGSNIAMTPHLRELDITMAHLM